MDTKQDITDILVRGGVPSASAAERWMRCPPSYNLEMSAGGQDETSAMDRGNRLHEAMERWEDDPIEIIQDLELSEDEADWLSRACEYRQRNLEKIFPAGRRMSYIEARRWITVDGHPVCSAKADFIATDLEGTYYIEDLKTGRIKAEDVQANKQLQVIAAALLETEPSVKRIFVSINQPYAPANSAFVEIPPEFFDALLTKVRIHAQKAIKSANTGHIAGDHCRYCRAQSLCPIAQSIVVRLASFKEAVKGLTQSDLARLLDESEMAEKAIVAIKDEAFERACAGNPPDGYKLAPKKLGLTAINELPKAIKDAANPFIETTTKSTQSRSIKDADALLAAMKAAGLSEAQEKKLTFQLKKSND